MVLRMTATRGYPLVVFQSLDVLGGDEIAELRNRIAAAGKDMRHDHVIVKMLAPKSKVNVSPFPSVKFPP